ncbi:MAG: type II toxin-antitoxin system death-on-curing family toxin [Anaerolineaceae bacterium]|nr:MAG: type II toxin-antitoxin system death-on-curing family toxin [Anaerolineaceae bacterium]
MNADEFLSAADVYSINEDVLGKRPTVINRHLLRVAVSRPYTRLFGQEAYPTLADKAAALLHSLAHDHLFADGNKRTARRAVQRFLHLHGGTITWTDEQAYTLILEIAKGGYDVKAVADRLAGLVRVGDEE